ncbi:hypothetical protein OHB54_04330 [Streptomyces sp. NBC_01007]|nr:hypothetical protein OHB54_04330 [Streptomyces sp. NBC_01007]
MATWHPPRKYGQGSRTVRRPCPRHSDPDAAWRKEHVLPPTEPTDTLTEGASTPAAPGLPLELPYIDVVLTLEGAGR